MRKVSLFSLFKSLEFLICFYANFLATGTAVGPLVGAIRQMFSFMLHSALPQLRSRGRGTNPSITVLFQCTHTTDPHAATVDSLLRLSRETAPIQLPRLVKIHARAFLSRGITRAGAFLLFAHRYFS